MTTVWNSVAVAEGLGVVEKHRAGLHSWFSELLDSYHGRSRPAIYYDVLAGDWLEHFLHQAYAAWNEVVTSGAGDGDVAIPVTADIAQSDDRRMTAPYEAQLRLAMDQLLNGGRPEGWQFTAEALSITKERTMRGRLKAGLLPAVSGFNGGRPQILVVRPYVKCSQAEWLKTLWRWRHWMVQDDLTYPISISARVDKKWRINKAMEVDSVTDFSNALRILVPLFIPVALLEGYEAYRKMALGLPVRRPHALYSANALHGHLTFKILAAEWRQEGTLLLYHQHGGGYGLDRVHALEEFEVRVSDRYYTWGWRRAESHVRPLSPAYPESPRRRKKYILLVVEDHPRILYRIQFQPMPGTIEIMQRETTEFLDSLSDRTDLLVRPYYDYGWAFTEAMRSAAPEARFDSSLRGTFGRFAESQMVVHNYLGSSWLETMALDIPSVCFYDPGTYSFRPESQPFIDELHRVGIMHSSGRAVASFVNSVRKNLDDWWRSADIQDARRQFIERYANFSPDWREQWEREFQSVVDV